MISNSSLIKEFLEEKYRQYASPAFLETDPIQIPHLYEKPQDIEVAALLTATLSWGQRPQIIRFAKILMNAMGHSPYGFVIDYGPTEKQHIERFQYRTFTPTDCHAFMLGLKHLYQHSDGLRHAFVEGFEKGQSVNQAITNFRRKMIGEHFPQRSLKHLSDPSRGSAAKRLNMFLRWMVRPNSEGVDFGLWDGIPTHALMLPIDLHSGRVARRLGLLERKSNDWRAVEEVTSNLSQFDPNDPAKYDFALFGLGIFEKF